MKITLTCIAAITLLLACDSKSPSTSNKSPNQIGVVSCKSFGTFGSDQYAESLQKLIQLSGWTNGKTSIEEFALGLCKGDIKDPDSLVKFGHITPMQATKIASLLGVSYSPPSPVPTTDVSAEPQQEALAYISKYLWGGGSAGGCTMQNALLVSYSPEHGEVISQNGKIIISGGKAVGSTQRAEYAYQNRTDQAFTYQGIVYADGNATVLAAGAKPGTVISDLTDTVTLISKDQIQINRSMTNIDTGILFDQRRVQYKPGTNKIEILNRCN